MNVYGSERQRHSNVIHSVLGKWIIQETLTILTKQIR